MHKKEYLQHIFYTLLMLTIVSFLMAVFIINFSTTQFIIFSIIMIFFFRQAYQPISSHLILLMFFIFSKKKYEIREQTNSYQYMIVRTMVKKPFQPYHYTNIIIDYIFTFFIKIMFKNSKYDHKKDFSNDFFIILKRDIDEEKVDSELMKIKRKHILNEVA